MATTASTAYSPPYPSDLSERKGARMAPLHLLPKPGGRPRTVERQVGRQPPPSAAIIDSQSVKTTERGGPHGHDGAKKLSGRKRHLLVNILAACILTACILDVTSPTLRRFRRCRKAVYGTDTRDLAHMNESVRDAIKICVERWLRSPRQGQGVSPPGARDAF